MINELDKFEVIKGNADVDALLAEIKLKEQKDDLEYKELSRMGRLANTQGLSKSEITPDKAVDLMAKEFELRRRQVKINPWALYERIDPEGKKLYIEQMKTLREDAAIIDNHKFGIGDERDAEQKTFSNDWMIPEILWNIDTKFWQEITRKSGFVSEKFSMFKVRPNKQQSYATAR